MTEQVPGVTLDQVPPLRTQLKYLDSCYGYSANIILTADQLPPLRRHLKKKERSELTVCHCFTSLPVSSNFYGRSASVPVIGLHRPVC